LAAGGQARWRHGAIECYGGLLGRWARYQRFAAITLGHVILARNARDARRWAAHERVHVHQYERWGLLFVPAYLVAGAWQGLRGHSPYTDNPFEKEAHSK
jgi:hypothetical protein